jgi:hypothetical protein
MAISVGLALSTLMFAPCAHAAPMQLGNYELQTNRYPTHAWTWAVNFCQPDCVAVTATPRPLRRGVEFSGTAHLAGSTYTLVNDAADGVICWGYTLPARDVYTWDAVTLVGTVQSTFDAGCNGSPGGANTWTFALNRM